MKKFIFLGLFTGITAINLLLLYALRNVNSAENPGFSQEILALEGDYDVRIDLEFLKEKFGSAHE